MSNKNAKVEFEIGVTPFSMSALTDSGDHKTFTSSASLFSESAGNEPDVRPNGLITGGAVIPAVAEGTDDVDVALLTCYLAGVKETVAATADVAITRPATNVSKVNSITVNSSGAIAVVAGTDGSTTAFSETRGAAGGPPYIPATSIEIAQVRVTSSSAAVITADQIFQVLGTHLERYDYPPFETDNYNGYVVFDAALPAIHTSDVTKKVYSSYAEPVFIKQKNASDFAPAEDSVSISSTQVYGGTVGTASISLGSSSFTAQLTDGITDSILNADGDIRFVRFYQDENKSAHILTQGTISFSRTFAAGERPTVEVTIAAENKSVNRES